MDVYEFIFPISVGDVAQATPDNTMMLRQVIGTCFSIGGDFYLTAAHVIKDALQYGWAGISFPYENKWHGSRFLNSETLDDLDIGVFKAETPNSKPLRWNTQSFPMLQTVQSIGYPYALDSENLQLTVRAFAGHIVSEQNFHELRGKPLIYELSFQAPRGLSGAPLLTLEKGKKGKYVSGLIIGNRTTQMLIFSDKELTSDGKKQTTTERYEALQFGIAIQSRVMLDANYNILGGTLRTHLTRHGLIKAQAS